MSDLLQTMDAVIAAFGDFVDAMGMIKSNRDFRQYENVRKAETTISTQNRRTASQYMLIKDNHAKIVEK